MDRERLITCPKCDGTGFSYLGDENMAATTICRFCCGLGKVDWIEMVLGGVDPFRIWIKDHE